MEDVAQRHPEPEGKPIVIANCQAGWQTMMMGAIRPDLTGPIILAGSPLSHWAGDRDKNPMRYLGGLLGGTWLTELSGDLGAEIFDGAHLVANFESLNPANTRAPGMRPSVMNVRFWASSRLAYKGLAASTIVSRFAVPCVRRSAFAFRRSIGDKLLPCSFCGDHARLGAVLDYGFKRSPILLLVSGQPKTGLHALELGVESRLRPTLHELGVRGLLIALSGSGNCETGSGEGGCGGRGSELPKESSSHTTPLTIGDPV